MFHRLALLSVASLYDNIKRSCQQQLLSLFFVQIGFHPFCLFLLERTQGDFPMGLKKFPILPYFFSRVNLNSTTLSLLITLSFFSFNIFNAQPERSAPFSWSAFCELKPGTWYHINAFISKAKHLCMVMLYINPLLISLIIINDSSK